jgi:hypothetical protein
LFGVAMTAPVVAAPIQFSALLRGEIGEGTNPFLRPGVTKVSTFGSGSFAPKFVYQDARSQTSLDGEYSRQEYFSRYGHTDSLRATLSRTDQLSAQVQSSLSASYATNNRAEITDPSQVANQDPLNIGRRTYQTSAQYQLQVQASAKDQLIYGAQVVHLAYGKSGQNAVNAFASDYTQVSVNGGYNRAIDARTSVGLQASLSSVNSKIYPNSRAIQPELTAKRQLNAVWEVDGHLGAVFQHIDGPQGGSTTNISYGANVCAAYPRTHICVSGQRQTSPSGYGSLSTNTGVSARVTHDLSEHSHFTVSANYFKTSASASQVILAVRNSRAFLSSAEYERDLTQRLSAGFGGTYQWRDTSGIGGPARSVAGTVHVTAKLGRM